ncbi:MAG: hypothetical protein WC782_09275 [Methylococcaceae bacterium]|jgi:hypothetical protein
MEQKPMTLVTEILPARLEELRNYLLTIGNDIKGNNSIQFSAYSNLHYCCLIIIEDEHPPVGSIPAKPILVFEANIDGTTQDFLNDLFSKNPAFMHKIYACCLDYSDDSQVLSAKLQQTDLGANAFYIAHPGQTRQIIEYQSKLRATIEDFIDANRPELIKLQPSDIKQKIYAYLTSQDAEFVNKKPAEPAFIIKNGARIFDAIKLLAQVIVVAIVFSALGWLGGGMTQVLAFAIIGLIIFYLAAIRWLESHDIQDERLHWESNYIKGLQDVEDRQPQNHLSSIIYVKPGKIRLFTLKLVLFLINVIAKLVATQGNLSGIVTIHFARWIVLPAKTNERTRLLFFSNYDGSWENYLGEFIDHASVGLTAVWSNTESGTNRGFPDTQWLALKGGARDEQRFKAFARNSQRRELIWYSAYADLSVKNIGNNQKIHDGLFSDTEISSWLKRL